VATALLHSRSVKISIPLSGKYADSPLVTRFDRLSSSASFIVAVKLKRVENIPHDCRVILPCTRWFGAWGSVVVKALRY
jgi:hypothetical protein